MGMKEDADLLRQYIETSSEAAFTELVTRYLPLVYSAALRQVRGDASLAKDVSQMVFIALANKAASLTGRDLLAGWLYSSARLAASNVLRMNHRRKLREQEAIAMQESVTYPQTENSELRVVLDEAMNDLGSAERNAILLRFFQGKDLKNVGLALGISEDAARMRVNRSVGKLHALLVSRGVTLSAATLATALASEGVSAAPAGLTAVIAEAALASAFTGAVTPLTIVKILGMTKLKIGIVTAIAVAGIATPSILQHRSQARLRMENKSLRARITELEAANAANERFAALGPESAQQTLAGEQFQELLKLRGEVARLRADAGELEKIKKAYSKLANNSVVRGALEAEARLARLNQLRKDRPDLVIPQFYLLHEGDFRAVAKDSDLETEDGVRRAFATLRNRAENIFASRMQPALKRYADEHNWQPPPQVSELAPYFDPQIEPSLLERYKVLYPPTNHVVGGWSGGWVICQNQPVDQMDARWCVSPVGFSSGNFDPSDEGK
ncbi:MAG: hypothetical protein C5B50_25770 [Verrucomicrobia bacterium]|nr:MAG: hypothetical protein C5B50_25770 [Verrucomicrobiota bacterium]